MFGCSQKVEQRIIAMEDIAVLDSCSFYNPIWKPTNEEINKAITSIHDFLLYPTEVDDWQIGEIKKIRENIKDYKIQVIGIYTNGRKRILCNFFDKEDINLFKGMDNRERVSR